LIVTRLVRRFFTKRCKVLLRLSPIAMPYFARDLRGSKMRKCTKTIRSHLEKSPLSATVDGIERAKAQRRQGMRSGIIMKFRLFAPLRLCERFKGLELTKCAWCANFRRQAKKVRKRGRFPA